MTELCNHYAVFGPNKTDGTFAVSTSVVVGAKKLRISLLPSSFDIIALHFSRTIIISAASTHCSRLAIGQDF